MMPLGHNVHGANVQFTLKLFNSLATQIERGHFAREVSLPVGSTVKDLCDELKLATDRVFLVLVNGSDISSGCVGEPVRTDYYIQDGDVVALSGPVPYSWGYGAPVV